MAQIYLEDLMETGFEKEATYGTRPTLSTLSRWWGVLKGTVDFPDPKIDWRPMYAHGGGRNPVQFNEGKHEHVGKLEFIVQNGLFLNLAMGGNLAETDQTTYQKHLIEPTLANDQDAANNYRVLPSFSWQVSAQSPAASGSDFVRTATGCKVNNMVIRGEEAGELVASLDVIAQSVQNDGTTIVTQSPSTDEVFMFDGGSLTLFGSSFSRLIDFNIEFKNNLNPRFYWDSTSGKNLTLLNERRREIGAKLRVDIEDDTIFDRLIAGKGSVFDVVMQCGRDNVATDYMKFTLKDCWLRAAPMPIKEEDVEAEAELDVIAGYMTAEVRDQDTNWWS